MPVRAEVVGFEKLDQYQRDEGHRHGFLDGSNLMIIYAMKLMM
jgi:hypothetical protein